MRGWTGGDACQGNQKHLQKSLNLMARSIIVPSPVDILNRPKRPRTFNVLYGSITMGLFLKGIWFVLRMGILAIYSLIILNFLLGRNLVIAKKNIQMLLGYRHIIPSEWHGSEEGMQHHKRLGEIGLGKYWKERQYQTYVCEECKKEFQSKWRAVPKYCSVRCGRRVLARKYYWKRRSECKGKESVAGGDM